MTHLEEGKPKEAWGVARAWHKEVDPAASPPCYRELEKQTVEWEKLYAKRPPPGERIPSNIERRATPDHPPEDQELRRAVKGLSNGKADGASKMRAEDLKAWLRGVESEEKMLVPGYEGADYRGAGDMWRLLVKLFEHIWRTGEIPQRMLLAIVVLIPKGNSGDYRGIGLLEVVWKVMERVLDARLLEIALHDYLHGFRAKRGTGTGIMEAKLIQQLAFRKQVPLYGIFLDLRKAFDAMDRSRCVEIMEDAGVGPQAIRLINTFLKKEVLVCRAAGFYGRTVKSSRGVTQGGPLSPTIFNLLMDVIVREWVRLMELKGFDTADICAIVAVFYADDGLIAARDPKTLQTAFDLLTGLFDRVGLATNTTKTEVMVFLPGRIRTCLSADAYKSRTDALHRATRGGKVECYVCKKTRKGIFEIPLCHTAQNLPLPTAGRAACGDLLASRRIQAEDGNIPSEQKGFALPNA